MVMADSNVVVLRRKREKVLRLRDKRRMSQELGWELRSQAEQPVKVVEDSETNSELLVRDTERLLLERRILGGGGEDMESPVVEVQEPASGSSSQSTKVVTPGAFFEHYFKQSNI